MNVKFSIIIPSLNNKDFLKNCLDSILKQTYKNYEIIVMDGGSTDGTKKLLAKYKKKIRYFIEKDRGQSDAINKGIGKSKGNWITWQNCDDYYYDKNALKIFYEYIKKNSEKDLFIGNIFLVNKSGEILRDVKYVRPSFLSLLYEDMTLTNQACFWKKSLNKKLGKMSKMQINFDLEWFLRILNLNKNCGHHINKELACYRIHSQQKTQKQTSKDISNKIKIKNKYGYKSFFFLPILIYLFIRKTYLHILNGNFYYILRGIFKFFFIKKNKEYIQK